MPQFMCYFNGLPRLVGCSKSAIFFHAILCQINGISRASLTPLGVI